MPRRNRVYRRDGKIVLVVDSVEHTMTEPAFLTLMEQAINVLQAIAGSRHKPAPRVD